MGWLLHLVQRGVNWTGPQPAHVPPRCTKCNSQPINGQCTNHRTAVQKLTALPSFWTVFDFQETIHFFLHTLCRDMKQNRRRKLTELYTNVSSVVSVVVSGSLAHPFPEYTEREHVFALSTVFGDAFLMQVRFTCMQSVDKSVNFRCTLALWLIVGLKLCLRQLKFVVLLIVITDHFNNNLNRYSLIIKSCSYGHVIGKAI